jgi:uncharacterized phage protein gp47/JayE
MKTADELFLEMKASWEREAGLVMNDGGDMALRLRALAEELEALWVQADFTAAQSFPQTASGLYLDYHAQVRGLKRAAAVPAEGSVRLTIGTALGYDMTIPAGVTCMTAGETAFVTTAPGVIAAGALYADIPSRAVEPGPGGNVPAGSVVLLPAPPTGVTGCKNSAAFTGGAGAESDEALRARVLQSYKTLPNGANAAYYESRALAVEGVAAVQVLPKNRGTGTVDVVVASHTGEPSLALVSAVQSALDGEREICVDIAVSAPTRTAVNVTASVKPAAGHSFAEVKSAVEAAVSAFFTGELLGGSVLRAGLISLIYGVPGVANCALTAPAADLAAAPTALPVQGTVTITEMS